MVDIGALPASATHVNTTWLSVDLGKHLAPTVGVAIVVTGGDVVIWGLVGLDVVGGVSVVGGASVIGEVGGGAVVSSVVGEVRGGVVGGCVVATVGGWDDEQPGKKNTQLVYI